MSEARTWNSINTCHGLLCIQWFEVRRGCLFCWHWWNCSLLLLKLSFHNRLLKTVLKNENFLKYWKLVLLWALLTKIYPPLPTYVQPISITKTLLIVLTKNESNPPLFTGKLLIKFQNILRNNTQVIIRQRVKILFSVTSSPITLEWQKWKSSKMKGILLSSPVNSWWNFKRF